MRNTGKYMHFINGIGIQLTTGKKVGVAYVKDSPLEDVESGLKKIGININVISDTDNLLTIKMK